LRSDLGEKKFTTLFVKQISTEPLEMTGACAILQKVPDFKVQKSAEVSEDKSNH